MEHDLIFFDNHYEANFKNKKGSKMYNERFNVILDESRNPINIKYKVDALNLSTVIQNENLQNYYLLFLKWAVFLYFTFNFWE